MEPLGEMLRKIEHAWFYGVPPAPPPKWVTVACCEARDAWFTVVDDDKSISIDCGDSRIWNAKYCPCCGAAFKLVPFAEGAP